MKRAAYSTILILLSAFAFAEDHPKLAPELRGAHAQGITDVIIQFNNKPENRSDVMKSKVAAHGGQVQHDFSFVHAMHATMPASRLAELEKDGEVTYISPNRKIGNLLYNSAGAVNANYAWTQGLSGAGIGVAIIDSGIHTDQDLQGLPILGLGNRVVANFDIIGGGPDDKYGHGTHVAGIIAGDGADSTCLNCTATFRGIASGASLINFHVLDQNGAGSDATVISAISQAIALKSQYNIRVINLSLGRPVYESYLQDPLCQAVEAAWNAGIVVVVAAGNDGRDNTAGTSGYGTINAPGNDPYVITVGAMNTVGTPDRADDIMTSYSSKGPTMIDHIAKPDLVAPGNKVISLLATTSDTLAQDYPANRPTVGSYQQNGPPGQMKKLSSDYFVLSGTSMAAPMVSAAAAILLQQNPQLTPDQVKARLMKTAYKNLPQTVTIVSGGQTFLEQADIFTVGAGYLDIQAAFNDNSVSTLSAASPAVAYDATSGNVYMVANPSEVWGSNALWGSSQFWGAQCVCGHFRHGSQR